ncbi:unnamed protein product [Orchesella dallaii]|uniref:Regulating synaptic membrane exocytosis protein 2 n=1 Tax=Orchesella dallaii TaxID=48710 RepID=A0ABP1PSE1_9HEXA
MKFRKADELKVLEETIRHRSEQQRKAGIGLDATCQLCLKTKFADGLGHVCAYCGVRCCARCGGKVTLRSSKVIWVCILCRKKQELIIKTGQWMNQPLSTSAPEKENRGPGSSSGSHRYPPPPLQRTSSLQHQGRELPIPQLRRQYSQENRPPPQMVPPPHLSQRRSSSSDPYDYYPHHYRDFDSGYGPPPPPAPTHPPPPSSSHHTMSPHSIHSSTLGHGPPPAKPPPVDWASPPSSSYDQRLHLHHQYKSSQLHSQHSISSSSQPLHHHSISGSTSGSRLSGAPGPSSSVTSSGGLMGPGGHRSLSSSEEELRSTPEYTSGDELDPRHRHSSRLQSTSAYLHGAEVGGVGGMSSLSKGAYDGAKTTSASGIGGGTSLLPAGAGVLPKYHHYHQMASNDARRIYQRGQKKTVRFDSDDFSATGEGAGGVMGAEEEWFWDQSSAERQGSQDSTTKDSGIDTCSNFTSSEDSNRELVHTKHPVSWRPNSDGTKLIGHMILKKDIRDGHGSSAHILGLKVTGGQVLENGRIGAIVEKVKKGSIADAVGRVRPGDEVIEWNGRGLVDRTFDEVHEIIADSKSDTQVELVLARPMGVGAPSSSASSSAIPSTSTSAKSYLSIRKDYKRPSVTVTSPTSPDPPRPGRFGPVQQAKIQIKIWFDPVGHQLLVRAINACDLSSRNPLPNPFAKVCLLPDRSEKWKRRTRAMQQTRDPRWNQTCVFAPIRLSEIRSRFLHVTVWDNERAGNIDYLGETSIELASHPLDDEPEWHFLTWDPQSSFYIDDTTPGPSSAEHLSPPSTTSRLSDSDTSELDYERRVENASISSSSSPPPDDLSAERRSRRDLSPLNRRVTTDAGDPYIPNREPLNRRSLSATSQFRSKSPPRQAFSPIRNESSDLGGPPMPRAHRSATVTPQGSPKKRQLPIVPPARERLSQDIEERARALKARMNKSSQSASSSYSSRGPSIENEGSVRSNRGISPDREFADSDLESVTSAFSTQSENPNRLRHLMYQTATHKLNRKPFLRHRSQQQNDLARSLTPQLSSLFLRKDPSAKDSYNHHHGGKPYSRYKVYFRNSSEHEYQSAACISYEDAHSARSYSMNSPDQPFEISTAAFPNRVASNMHLSSRSRANECNTAGGNSTSSRARRLSRELIATVDSIRDIIHDVRTRLTQNNSQDSWTNLPLLIEQATSGNNNDISKKGAVNGGGQKKSRLAREIVEQKNHVENPHRDDKSSRLEAASQSHHSKQMITQHDSRNGKSNMKHEIGSSRRCRESGEKVAQDEIVNDEEDESDSDVDESCDDDSASGSSTASESSTGYYEENGNGSRKGEDGNVEKQASSSSITTSSKGSQLGIPRKGLTVAQNSSNQSKNKSEGLSKNTKSTIKSTSSSPNTAAFTHVNRSSKQSLASSEVVIENPRHKQHPHRAIVFRKCNASKKCKSDPGAEPAAVVSSCSRRTPTCTDDDDRVNIVVVENKSPSSDTAVDCSPDHGNCSEYTLRHPKRSLGTRSLSSETAPEEKADGSLSDTAVNLTPGSLERSRGHRMPGGAQRLSVAPNMSGLNKKSSSTSQLSATGRKRRLGFGRSKVGIGIHRSEEVLPDELRLAVSQAGSSVSSEDMSGSQDTSDSWLPRLSGAGDSGHITDFIEGLGPGQLVGRQVLASPSLGEIQLSLCDRRGNLEVEVIRARGLQAKSGSKMTPAPYVKVYLVKGKKCVAKSKTGIARRTLDPLYQQQLTFREKYQGCILQVTVWGDYGRIEGRKIFMGVAQIMLDDLDLSNIVIGWYKLFGTSSLV